MGPDLKAEPAKKKEEEKENPILGALREMLGGIAGVTGGPTGLGLADQHMENEPAAPDTKNLKFP